MIKDLPTMEVSTDTTQPKTNSVQSPDLIAIIRGAKERGVKKKKKERDRTQTQTLDTNDPELRNR